MYRTIFFNLWAALIAFAIYFGYTIYQTNGFATPMPTLVYAFLWGAFGFIVAYGLRYVLDYIFYTPEQAEMSISTDDDATVQNINNTGATKSTKEFQDENPEEIAQVVRTMLHQENSAFDK
jgi:hypothetical protein